MNYTLTCHMCIHTLYIDLEQRNTQKDAQRHHMTIQTNKTPQRPPRAKCRIALDTGWGPPTTHVSMRQIIVMYMYIKATRFT